MGGQGRYPTPLNVAQMAVEMLDPGPHDRVFDGSCGTGTFLDELDYWDDSITRLARSHQNSNSQVRHAYKVQHLLDSRIARVRP